MGFMNKKCVVCKKNSVESPVHIMCPECYAKATEQDVHINKKDLGKLPWHLLSEDMLEDVVRVLQFGRTKYAENSWQNIGPDEYGNPPLVRYQDALKRHLAAFNRGETIDEESGLPALAHAACNALFIAWLEKHPECNQSGPDVHEGK